MKRETVIDQEKGLDQREWRFLIEKDTFLIIKESLSMVKDSSLLREKREGDGRGSRGERRGGERRGEFYICW
ncbi:hypothetical protein NC652_036031 [Populus alba x Populus x berolinensis]|nr:hypothetical protein NC652_036031 [Populus alba x Populus x berolinensis]